MRSIQNQGVDCLGSVSIPGVKGEIGRTSPPIRTRNLLPGGVEEEFLAFNL